MKDKKEKISVLYSDIKDSPCPHCKKSTFPINPELMEKYFRKDKIQCPHCDTELDLWQMLYRHFEWGHPSYFYALIGGINSWIKIFLKPNKTLTLDFIKLGMPHDAKILNLGYTPNAQGVFPIELHGNTPIRHIIPKTIHLFGKPFNEIEEDVETPIIVSVDWIPMDENNELWYNLIEAFESFACGQFKSTIIPANVAIESKLYSILLNYFENLCGKEKSNDFLSNAATYSHQLNILLPLLSDKFNFPRLPEFITGNLNRLRRLRNELAHKGSTTNIEKKECANLLLSTVFCMSYLILFEKKLNKVKEI